MYFLRHLIDVITMPLRALLYAPGRLLGGSRRALSISLPARVAWLTAFFLIVCAVVSIVVFITTHDRAEVRAKITSMFIIAVTVLVIVIPIVLYRALKLWLEGDVSPFPDILRAWRAGLVELERQGLELNRTPLFLVLGSADQAQEKTLLEASRVSFHVTDYPAGPEALHWYAGPDAIYLVCSKVGSLSWLAHAAGREIASSPPAAPAAPGPGPGDQVRERSSPTSRRPRQADPSATRPAAAASQPARPEAPRTTSAGR